MRAIATLQRLAAIVAAVLVALLANSLDASAHGMRKPRGSYEGTWFFGDERGCYWVRGRRYCGRYCYWEVNGRRYCHDRERLAEPQGDPTYVPRRVEPPIYIRPPHGRP